ncbi:hypothetical protein BDN67DRAFT_984757 [Paxillus ammoniavirescens]|nr:hypothetical protein BDN67DRAFT_984757 [Paxillus ammoniavirescens]
MSDSDAGGLIPKAVHCPRARRSVLYYRADQPAHTLKQAKPQLPDPDHSSDHDSHSSSHNDAASVILNVSGTLKDQDDQSTLDPDSKSESDDRPVWGGVGQGCPVDKRGRYKYSQIGQYPSEIFPDSCDSETAKSTTQVPLAAVSAPVNEPLATPCHTQGITDKPRVESLPDLHHRKCQRLGPAFELGVQSHRTRVDLLDTVVREVGKMVQNSLDRQTEVLSGILEAIRSKNN